MCAYLVPSFVKMAATLYTADEIGRRTSADYKNNKTPKRDPYCSESAIDILQEFTLHSELTEC